MDLFHAKTKVLLLRITCLFLLYLMLTSSFSAQVCNGTIGLVSQAQVDAFNCTEVTGDFFINGSSSIINGDPITDLSGLSELTKVGGDFQIAFIDAVNLDGLANLESVGGTFSIIVNPNLNDITGLYHLASINGQLGFYQNPSLVSLDGLSSLTVVNSDVIIDNNSSLVNLNGLSSLMAVGGNLIIFGNSNLSDCCGIAQLLEGPGAVTGNIFISNNASGCDSNEEAVEDCDLCIEVIVNELIAYINSLDVSLSIKKAINSRLDLAATKFCIGYPTSIVIASMDYVANYVQYQSGIEIPVSNANYIIGQVNMLIDALNNGIVACCAPSVPRSVGSGQATLAGPLQLYADPNPFHGQLSIRFYMPQAGRAALRIFNLNGQQVAALYTGYLNPGYQAYHWNGADNKGQQLRSGIYLVRLQTESGVLTQKVSLAW